MKIKNLFLVLILLTSFLTEAAPWIQKASFGGTGRHRATGLAIGNKGYIGLGHVNGTGINYAYKDWWQYDPASDSWTQKSDYPVVNYGATAFSTDTKAYIGGGAFLNGEFYEYNPITNTWAQIATCPLSPGDAQVFSVQNKGYVYSGNLFYEYDPATDLWTAKANTPTFFSSWSTAFASETSGFVRSGSAFYEYKPSQDQWISRASFPGLTTNGGAAFTKDNKGYFVCGFVGSLAIVTNEVWEFNPGTNSWLLIGDFMGAGRRFPVAFSINNKGYFGTGTNGLNMKDFWQFDFDPLSINELAMENIEVNVYPNPAVENINFQFSGNNLSTLEKCTLHIYSTDGREVKTSKILSNNLIIERENLTNGVYFYSIVIGNEKIKSGKFTYY